MVRSAWAKQERLPELLNISLRKSKKKGSLGEPFFLERV
jgi:hypothetical protein